MVVGVTLIKSTLRDMKDAQIETQQIKTALINAAMLPFINISHVKFIIQNEVPMTDE